METDSRKPSKLSRYVLYKALKYRKRFRPFSGDAYHANTRLSMNSLILNEKYSKEVNDDLFRNLKFLDRGPLELSIIKSNLTDGLNKVALENYLISERLCNQFINKYSDGPLNEDFPNDLRKLL